MSPVSAAARAIRRASPISLVSTISAGTSNARMSASSFLVLPRFPAMGLMMKIWRMAPAPFPLSFLLYLPYRNRSHLIMPL